MNAIFAVAAAFGVGAIIIQAASLLPSAKPVATELWRFYRSEFAIVGCLLLPAAGGKWIFLALLLAMAWRGVEEWFDLFAVRSTLERATATLACMVLVTTAVLFPAWLFSILGIAALLVLAVCAIPGRSLTAPPVWAAVSSLFYPGLTLALAGLFLTMRDGFAWTLLVYATVEMNDAFALVVGKMFGRRPVLPRLSPRKTWAGLIGGLAIGSATGLLIATFVLGIGLAAAAIAVAVILAAGLAGDLLSSALKRWQGRKDFKPLAAAHGGLLDIYDSFLFAIPAALLLRIATGV